MVTHKSCDLLVTSTDSFLPEARLTICQLKRLGLAQYFDCYLMMGKESPSIENFTTLNNFRRGTWSSDLREALMHLEKPYVLLWLDDFVPISMLSKSIILNAIDELVEIGGNYLRLNPTPPGNGPLCFQGFCEILPGELYRTSTVLSVWRRELLLNLLDDNETAWQFEFLGSVRSDSHLKFYASNIPHIECVNLVVKGLLDPRAGKLLLSNGISLAEISRRLMSRKELLYLRMRDMRSNLLRLLHWKLRRRIRHYFSVDLKSLD